MGDSWCCRRQKNNRKFQVIRSNYKVVVTPADKEQQQMIDEVEVNVEVE